MVVKGKELMLMPNNIKHMDHGGIISYL